MRIYLDNCCYNRHHDKKISDEIVADRNAVVAIQKEIIRKEIELVTSFMLHYENYQNKNVRDRNYNDFFIKNYKTIYVGVENLNELAEIIPGILNCGVKIKDAYHIASAILTECDFFVTVDKKLLRVSLEEIRIINLVELAKILEG